MAAEVMAQRFATPTRASAIGRPLAWGGAGDEEGAAGAVRVKVVLTKKQLRQVVAAMGPGRTSGAPAHRLAAGPSLEQLLHALRGRRRQVKRTETVGPTRCRSRWRPELQSIPEEV